MSAFVNSLPKAGTNLVAKCLELLGLNFRGHIGSDLFLGARIDARIRRHLLRPVRQGFVVGIDTPVEIPRKWTLTRLKRLGTSDFLTGHIGYMNDLLFALEQLDIKPIVVIRDPRAVLNSFVHFVASQKNHALHTELKELSIEQRIIAALYGRSLRHATLQPLKVRCLSLQPWIDSSNTLVVRFENLVGERGGGSTELQRETLIEIAQFLEAGLGNIRLAEQELFGSGKMTFRRGTIHSWQTELPMKTIRLIEAELGDILEAWGYESPL